MTNTSKLPMQIVKIKRVVKEVLVYNLSVKDDESYIANGVVSHNCRCELIPDIQDEWADDVVNKNDEEWDSNSGLVYTADDTEKKYGSSDMTFDQFISMVGKNANEG